MFLRIYYRIKRLGFVGFISSLYYASKYVLWKYILCAEYIHRRMLGFTLKLRISDVGLSRELVTSGIREVQLKYLLQKYLDEGSTVLDLGANIGYYALIMSKIIKNNGRIIAIEPAPDNYNLLSDNIKINNLTDNVKLYNIGVSNKVGVEKFYLSDYGNMHTFVKDSDNYKDSRRKLKGDHIDVPVTDLSSFIDDIGNVDFIRMDIEGYEVEVLQGLERAIKDGSFTGGIVFEVHRPQYTFERSLIDQLQMMFKYGYTAKAITSTDESTSLISNKYSPLKVFQTNDSPRYRAIYEDISNDDLLEYISTLGGVRDIYLSK